MGTTRVTSWVASFCSPLFQGYELIGICGGAHLFLETFLFGGSGISARERCFVLHDFMLFGKESVSESRFNRLA